MSDPSLPRQQVPVRDLNIETYSSAPRRSRRRYSLKSKVAQFSEDSLANFPRENLLEDTSSMSPEDIEAALLQVNIELDNSRKKNLQPATSRSETKRRKREFRKLNKEAKNDPLKKLTLDVQNAGNSFMNQVKYSGVTEPKVTKSQQEIIMNNKHNWYSKMMMFQLFQPLRNGVTADSLIRVIGMSSALTLLSPDFRSQIGSFAGNVRNAISNRLSGRRNSKQEAKNLAVQDQLDLVGGDEAKLSRRWRRRLNKIENAAPGERSPYSNESAAMTKIALLESAYMNMRDPSIAEEDRASHIEEVRASYESANQILDNWIEEDDLDNEAINAHMLNVVGRRMAAEPHLASVFPELAHGRFKRTDVVRSWDVSGEQVETWDGKFIDAVSGEKWDGPLTLREPGSVTDHIEQCSITLGAELSEAKDLDDLNLIFSNYTAGSLARRYIDLPVVDDDMAQSRINQAISMFRSMDEDNISQVDQRRIYAEGFVNALDHLNKKNPALVKEWEEAYGPEWKVNVKNVVEQFSDIGEIEERNNVISILLERGLPLEKAEVVADVRKDQVAAKEESYKNYDREQEEADHSNLLAQMQERTLANSKVIYEPMNLPGVHSGDSNSIKAMAVVDQLSQTIYQDIVHASGRDGFYYKGGDFEVALGEINNESSEYIDSAFFVTDATETWFNVDEMIEMGGDYVDGDFSDLKHESQKIRAARAAHMSRANQALASYGIPEETRDQVLSAAVTNGLNLALADDKINLVVASAMDSDNRNVVDTNDVSLNEVFNSVLKNTGTGAKYTLGANGQSGILASYSGWMNKIDSYDDKVSAILKNIKGGSTNSKHVDVIFKSLTEGTTEQDVKNKRRQAAKRVKEDAVMYEQRRYETKPTYDTAQSFEI